MREREERLREAMLIVGLSEGALYLSWWITYTLLYAVIGEGCIYGGVATPLASHY